MKRVARSKLLSLFYVSTFLAIPLTSIKADSQTCDKFVSAETGLSRGQSWSSCTGYTLTLQNDGNLVLYASGGRVFWATGTEGSKAERLTFQRDGNLVLYAAGNKPLWASNSLTPNSTFVVQADGNLVVYAPGGKAVWTLGTVGKSTGTSNAACVWSGTCSPSNSSLNPILKRAKEWVDRGIPYNQQAYYQGYRQDCSGFISMAWALPTSAVTGTLPQYAKTLGGKDDLQPGDAINNRQSGDSGHVVMFVKWKDKGAGKFISYEENGGWGKTLQTDLTLRWENGSWNIPEYANHAPWYLERKK